MKFTPRLLLLTGINGVLSFFVLATIERVINHYADVQLQIDMQRGPVGYILQPQPFWNLTMLLFHVGLYLIAAGILRFLLNDYRTILFWLSSAFVVVLLWAIIFLFGVVASNGTPGESPVQKALEALVNRSSQRAALIFLVAVVGVNATFGVIVRFMANHGWRRPHYS